jgi:hypothetical protein
MNCPQCGSNELEEVEISSTITLYTIHANSELREMEDYEPEKRVLATRYCCANCGTHLWTKGKSTLQNVLENI